VRHPPDGGRVACIGEDPDAFEAFYRGHIDAVVRYAARRTHDPHAAADLVAEIFLAAIETAGNYREERGSPAAWLFGIARNVVAAEHRRAARAHLAESRLAGRRLLDGDDIARLEERIDAERDCRALLGRIAALPPGQRALLELVAVDGLALPEAAAVLGITALTARVRLHRARRALSAEPEPDADSPDLPRSIAALTERP
jgi:RNA polymerase sigma-70 factor (ECF subfamily)